MLSNPPPIFRKRNLLPKRTEPATPPPAEPPVLIGATYTPGQAVTLSFDRPVSDADAVPATIVVVDALLLGITLVGTGVMAINDTLLEVALQSVGGAQGESVTLDVSGDNGIVAVDGSTPWAGASGLVLPFGE